MGHNGYIVVIPTIGEKGISVIQVISVTKYSRKLHGGQKVRDLASFSTALVFERHVFENADDRPVSSL